MPKVSVIIPVYNVENYLRQCLDSVINQTLKDIEIILVDDGSTDSSLSICNEYAQKDNRITVLTQQNKGAGAARNMGIESSHSEFVIFLDSDDYYPELDILETLYNKAKENNVLICGGSFSDLYKDQITSSYKDTFTGYTFKENKVVKYTDYQFDYGYHRFIYNLNFLKENNICFPDYKRFQDPPFFVQAMYTAKEFYALAQITYLLRGGHKTINWTNDKKRGLINGIKDNLEFAQKHNLEKLYYLTCERLNQHAYAFGLVDVFNIRLQRIIKSLDWKIIKKYNKEFKLSDNFSILKTIFSIKNSYDKNHKVVTILGKRFYFKKAKQKRVLVHIHLYYHEQIDYFISKLSNINNCYWDLYVTYSEENEQSRNKVLNIKPNAKFVKCPNIGYDILPFINVLQLVDLKNYDYILKIHTKAYREQQFQYWESGYGWRNILVNALLGSKHNFYRCLKYFEKNKNIGIIAAKNCIRHMSFSNRPEDTVLYKRVCKIFNLPDNRGHFVCGTMFMCRASLMQLFKNLKYSESFFHSYEQRTGMEGTPIHVMERLFGTMTEAQGYVLYGIEDRKQNLKKFKLFIQNIFSIKNENKHKIFKILGVKLKVKYNK